MGVYGFGCLLIRSEEKIAFQSLPEFWDSTAQMFFNINN